MEASPSPDELFLLADKCYQVGRLQEADALYRQVLILSPGHLGALRGLAELARQMGAHKAAMDLLEAALRIAPDLPELHVQAGQVYFENGNYQAAIHACEQALVLQPDHAEALSGLAASRAALALAVDPDYADLNEPAMSERGVLEELANHATLLVLFAGLGVGTSPPTFIFRRFLAGYPADKVFLRDLSLSWYFLGIPGVSHDVYSTAEFLREKAKAYRRTVFVGCSAGATAAILYGQLIGVDKVLAFAPQTILSERKPRELNDQRWEERLTCLRREVAPPNLLDVATLQVLTVPVDVYYPDGVALDCCHAEVLTGPGLSRFPQPGDSHLIALTMRDHGLLGPIIAREIPS